MFDHFFVVGAQRSGTTYLYHLLAGHPEIEMAGPVWPEPKHFLVDCLYERGLEYYENHLFQGKEGAWLRGEKSASYLESEKAAVRVARCFPNAKIVMVLRDPIERAISNYCYSVENGLETLPMSQAFLDEDERWLDYDHDRTSVSPYAYLRRGRYIEYVEMYLRYFPEKSTKVVLFEELVESGDTVRDLCGFLSVSPDAVPSGLRQAINASGRPHTELSSEIRRYLVDYFAEPNARLAERLGLDLSVWGH